jgi:glycosyltransferase involved in cell wall biosynthesis
MNLVILTFGHADTGSTKYRMRQFSDQWQAAGFNLHWIEKNNLESADLDKIESADLVINQKCLLPTSFAQKIRRVARRILFDFDDALWTRASRPYGFLTRWKVQRRLHFWLHESDLVTTANHVLADYAVKHSRRVQVVPMAIDTDVWKPAETPPSVVRLGYAGSPASLPYLIAIAPRLHNLPAQLSVMSGERPHLQQSFDYHSYMPEREVSFVQNLTLGLLPLAEDDFSRAKSPIKALQYLACGVPVVGNFIGASAEFLDNKVGRHIPSETEWAPLIRHLLAQPEQIREFGLTGRQRVLEHHDKNRVGQKWIELIRTALV